MSTSNTSTAIRRATRHGLVLNVLLSLLKFSVGVWAHSQACIADAVHSLSDSVTDIAVIVGVGYWTAPADASHPHGHRRIETLVTLFIGCSLGAVSVLMAWRGVSTIGKESGNALPWPVFAVALVSMVCKEALYRWQASEGARCHSSSLVANAWHHRSDALSSIPVALAALTGRLWPSAGYVDHVAAVIVSAMLLKASWDIAWPSLQELADAGADAELRAGLLNLASGVAGVREVHGLRTRRMGPGYSIDLHVLVEPDITVREGNTIGDHVREQLIENEPRVIDVLIHLEPYEKNREETSLGGTGSPL